MHLARSIESTQLLTAIPQKRLIRCKANCVIFRKGDAADSIYYVQSGQVKISRTSPSGREAIIAILTRGDFIGEACLIGEPVRVVDAVCLTPAQLYQIDKNAIVSLIREDSRLAEDFMAYLLSRNSRYQDDLEDQLNNSTKKRLARTLLLLAHFGTDDQTRKTFSNISHSTLAQMVGTTRARISELMNSFRKSGLVDYNRNSITVDSKLIDVIIRDS